MKQNYKFLTVFIAFFDGASFLGSCHTLRPAYQRTTAYLYFLIVGRSTDRRCTIRLLVATFYYIDDLHCKFCLLNCFNQSQSFQRCLDKNHGRMG